MTTPYRENQYTKDVFDMLDDNDSLKKESILHEENLKLKALEIVKKSGDKIENGLKEIRRNLVRTKKASCTPIEFVYYNRTGYESQECVVIDSVITDWFVEKLKSKGFKVVTHAYKEITIFFNEPNSRESGPIV